MRSDILWALFLGSLFTIIFQVGLVYLEGPVPYRNVVVEDVQEVDEGYIVTANFVKTDCTFQRLEVFGVNTGVPIYLVWQPLDGSPSTDYDRSIGRQHMKILANKQGWTFDTLEIRTRHDCDGVIVDRVFASIRLSDWEDQTGDL